jgi:hypothetical protein
MTKLKFEDLPHKVQMLGYLKMSYEHMPDIIFCTSNPELQKAADDLIAEGLVIELEGPGGADRAFGLTDAGKTHVNISVK